MMAPDPAHTVETPSPTLGSDTIFRAALVCRSAFEEYLQSPRLYQQQVIRMHHQYRTWAGFLGVFAPVKISLDARLADAPEVEELVLSMLTLLSKNIRRGLKRHALIPVDNSKEDERRPNDSIMSGIEGAMDRLSRLALIIRSSPKSSDIQSVLNYSRIRGPDGFDDLIMLLVRSRFGPTETNSCQTQPAMPESLQFQLGSSVIYRRNRLLYELRREKKFKADRFGEDVSETTLSGLPEGTQRAALAELMRSQDTSPASQTSEGFREAANVTSYQNPLLRAVLTKSRAKVQRDDDKTSNASTSRSNNPFIAAEYPKAPKIPPGHSSVACTICRKPQFKDTVADEKSWRRHVEKDLQPYVCVSEECGNFPPSFSSRHSWRDHMCEHRQDWAQYIHRPHQWICAICGTATSPFDSEKLLLQHLEHEHKNGILGGARPDMIASRGKTHLPLDTHICPFCGNDVTLEGNAKSQDSAPSGTWAPDPKKPIRITTTSNTDQATTPTMSLSRVSSQLTTIQGNALSEHRAGALSIQMWKHIADHLESVALWSLRWWNEDSGIPEEADQDSCNTQDRMSDDALSQDETRGFEDRIFDSFEKSQFPHPGEEFLPANTIDILVTEDVLLEMFPNILDTENGTILASFILQTSKRLFTITALHCGFDSDTLMAAMEGFKTVGFNDEQLPIPDPKNHPQLIPEAFLPSATGMWGRAKLESFYRFQWRYLSPVFSTYQFRYVFEPNHIMPFIWVSQTSREGGFSRVFEAHLHQAHWTVTKPIDHEAPFSVALREFFAHREDSAGEEWERESHSAEQIRHFHHPHILEPLASILIGSRRFLMYEWADGGNLREYWKEIGKPKLSKKLVLEVVVQLHGLADALCQMHKSSLRHGDLKPENTLRVQDTSNVGKLMLGDLGLVKRHVLATQSRERTSKGFRTIYYEPPEYRVSPDHPRSRRADIWPMGCIILEFIIWLLYGWDDLSYFHSRINEKTPGYSRFYEMSSAGQATVNPIVEEWMDVMASDPSCNATNGTALGDLLQFVRERLLVIRLEPLPGAKEETERGKIGIRATAQELLDGLTAIFDRGKHTEDYWGTNYNREEVLDYAEMKKRRREAKNKLPIKFRDAVGRRFSFPFGEVLTWEGMEEMIRQMFIGIDGLRKEVQEGRYDLIGPNGEIILPQIWERAIQPDWAIEMRMWSTSNVALVSWGHQHAVPSVPRRSKAFEPGPDDDSAHRPGLKRTSSW